METVLLALAGALSSVVVTAVTGLIRKNRLVTSKNAFVATLTDASAKAEAEFEWNKYLFDGALRVLAFAVSIAAVTIAFYAKK